jgi:hypothetical protein
LAYVCGGGNGIGQPRDVALTTRRVQGAGGAELLDEKAVIAGLTLGVEGADALEDELVAP